MNEQEIIKTLVKMNQDQLKPLFKPKQILTLKKIVSNEKLTETESRYFRGAIRKKISILSQLANHEYISRINGYTDFLNLLGRYYITGLEALKNNGFGWEFNTKIIEVINTKLNGEIVINNKEIKLIKTRSIKNKEVVLNKQDGLVYATNEQVGKDYKLTRNETTKRIWTTHYQRYDKSFSKISLSDLKW